jgi:hypothetical protein
MMQLPDAVLRIGAAEVRGFIDENGGGDPLRSLRLISLHGAATE